MRPQGPYPSYSRLSRACCSASASRAIRLSTTGLLLVPFPLPLPLPLPFPAAATVRVTPLPIPPPMPVPDPDPVPSWIVAGDVLPSLATRPTPRPPRRVDPVAASVSLSSLTSAPSELGAVRPTRRVYDDGMPMPDVKADALRRAPRDAPAPPPLGPLASVSSRPRSALTPSRYGRTKSRTGEWEGELDVVDPLELAGGLKPPRTSTGPRRRESVVPPVVCGDSGDSARRPPAAGGVVPVGTAPGSDRAAGASASASTGDSVDLARGRDPWRRLEPGKGDTADRGEADSEPGSGSWRGDVDGRDAESRPVPTRWSSVRSEPMDSRLEARLEVAMLDPARDMAAGDVPLGLACVLKLPTMRLSMSSTCWRVSGARGPVVIEGDGEMDDVADDCLGAAAVVVRDGPAVGVGWTAVVVVRGDCECGAIVAGGVQLSSCRKNACTSSLSGASGLGSSILCRKPLSRVLVRRIDDGESPLAGDPGRRRPMEPEYRLGLDWGDTEGLSLSRLDATKGDVVEKASVGCCRTACLEKDSELGANGGDPPRPGMIGGLAAAMFAICAWENERPDEERNSDIRGREPGSGDAVPDTPGMFRPAAPMGDGRPPTAATGPPRNTDVEGDAEMDRKGCRECALSRR